MLHTATYCSITANKINLFFFSFALKEKRHFYNLEKSAIITRYKKIKTKRNMSDFSNTLLDEAERLKTDGRHEDAIKVCERMIMSDLDCVAGFEELGDNYLSLRQYDKALKALEYAVKLDAHSANANYLLGFAYSAVGRWNDSVRLLEHADELQPNHPEILRCLGWSIFHFGQKKKGVIVLERSLNLAGTDPLVMCDLGVCYLNEKNFARAIQLFEKVLAVEPENDKARECLKACQFFEKEYGKLKRK